MKTVVDWFQDDGDGGGGDGGSGYGLAIVLWTTFLAWGSFAWVVDEISKRGGGVSLSNATAAATSAVVVVAAAAPATNISNTTNAKATRGSDITGT